MKKVLELCIYVAILIAVAIYSMSGGYKSKTAQPPPTPPMQEFEIPTTEPRPDWGVS